MAYRSTAVREIRGYRPSAPRTRGKYAGQEAAAVAKDIRRSKWTGRALIADLNRIARGTCQASLLWSIYYATEGAPHATKGKRWKAPDWSEPMLPEDFAKEGGFTPQQMRDEIEDAIARKLITRKGATGDPKYQFQLCRAEWGKLPNAYIPRKPFGAAEFTMPDDYEEDSDECEEANEANTEGYEASRETVVARKEVKPGSVRFAPKTRYNFAATPVTSIEYQSQAPLRARLTAAGLLVILDAAERKLAAAATISGSADVAKAGGYEASRETAVARNGKAAASPPYDYLAELAKLKLFPGLPLQKEIELALQDTPARLLVILTERRQQELGHKFKAGLLQALAQDARRMWVFQRKTAEALLAAPTDADAASGTDRRRQIAMAEVILTNPYADEQDRQWARQILDGVS